MEWFFLGVAVASAVFTGLAAWYTILATRETKEAAE